MFALVKSFIVKYLAGMTGDELKSLLEDFAALPQFAPFASIVQDVLAEQHRPLVSQPHSRRDTFPCAGLSAGFFCDIGVRR